MAGLLQSFQQLQHGRRLANLSGTCHHLEQLAVVPARPFEIVNECPLEYLHVHELYSILATNSYYSLAE